MLRLTIWDVDYVGGDGTFCGDLMAVSNPLRIGAQIFNC